MEAKQFHIGDLVYSADGQAAQYVAQDNDGHIVRPWIAAQDHDGADYDYLLDPAIWREVFAEAPIAKFCDELKEIHAKIEEAKTELRELNKSHSDFQREAKTRAAERSRIEQLRHLDDFISGKITHFVIQRSGTVTISDFTSGIAQGDWRGRPDGEMRLLSLFGDTKGNLSWKLNTYRDGSGDWTNVRPCTSLEDAKTQAAVVLDEIFASWRAGGDHKWHCTYAVESAIAFGIAPPADAVEHVRNTRLKNASDRVEEAKKRLADAEADLAKAGVSA